MTHMCVYQDSIGVINDLSFSGQEYEMMSPVDNSEKLSRRVMEEAVSSSHSPMPLSAIEERLSGVR